MDGEAVIALAVEHIDGQYIVTCDDFPLLAILVSELSAGSITKTVLPVLKEMIEFKVDSEVELRLVDSYRSESVAKIPAPHVIAQRIDYHVG